MNSLINTPLKSDEFQNLLLSCLPNDFHQERLAVAVSGGADSLALTKLLSEWGGVQNIHALTVDHGLRRESADEAVHVGQQIHSFPNTTHVILKWDGERPDTRIQEEARKARYQLMAEYCAKHNIQHLFLAHHADDQAETFLFRLAKGSGLDGLTGMRTLQDYDDHLTLVRPLLSLEKSRLIATCAHYGLIYIDDPTNFCEDYARPRLRASRAVLETEGLSTKRLATTAQRLQRARAALDEITDNILGHALSDHVHEDEVRLAWRAIKRQPEEITLRLIIKVIHSLKPNEDYLPRMEKIESLVHDLMRPTPFRKRTLGGLVFARDDEYIMIGLET